MQALSYLRVDCDINAEFRWSLNLDTLRHVISFVGTTKSMANK